MSIGSFLLGEKTSHGKKTVSICLIEFGSNRIIYIQLFKKGISQQETGQDYVILDTEKHILNTFAEMKQLRQSLRNSV